MNVIKYSQFISQSISSKELAVLSDQVAKHVYHTTSVAKWLKSHQDILMKVMKYCTRENILSAQ